MLHFHWLKYAFPGKVIAERVYFANVNRNAISNANVKVKISI